MMKYLLYFSRRVSGSGPIPEALEALSKLQDLSLSINKLTGKRCVLLSCFVLLVESCSVGF